MKELKFLLLVTERDYTEDYLEFLKEHRIKTIMKTFCYGTATDSILEVMGLTKKEKVVLLTVVPTDDVSNLMTDLKRSTNIDVGGNGFAVIIPTGGFSESAVEYFVKSENIKKEMGDMSEVKTENSLIITSADRGNVEIIMDAARSAGATGGTLVKANGTGSDIAKIMGISISEEKDMVFIATKKSDRNAIMNAIMEKAGAGTDAHGIVFSLPVEKVVGIKEMEDI